MSKASPTRVAKRWKKLPKGWTDESVRKFWDNLTSAAPKHKVTECIKQMEGKFDNPGAFCGGLADWMIPGWRQEAAKERRDKKAGMDRWAEEIDRGFGAMPLSLRPDYGTSDAALPRGEDD